MANGDRHQFPEINLRFKTDGSREGPERGKPAFLPAALGRAESGADPSWPSVGRGGGSCS
jgi:hypothetical protein